MRKSFFLFLAFALLMPPAGQSFAAATADNTRMSTVFIANYDRDGNFTGWGSGFFVDEGIVITNKHVIEGGQSYRIFSTDSDGTVDLSCYKDIQKSDVKINLEDDIAYIRVFIHCPHGIVQFASADPDIGAKVSVNITSTPADPFNPQRPGRRASNIACVKSLGSGGEATGAGGCRCRASYHKDPTGTMCLPGAEARKNPRTFRTPVKDPAESKRQRLRVREAAKSVKIYVKKRGI